MSRGEDLPTEKGQLHPTEILKERKSITKPVKRLAWYTHRRDYLKLCRVVRTLVEDYGWKETVSLIEKIPVWSEIKTHKWAYVIKPKEIGVIPVRRGKIRDGLLRVLGLEGVVGIDADVLKMFKRIKTNEFQNLREKAVAVAFKHLKRQIKKSTTFHLDIERMLDTPLQKLVPSILEQRRKEFIALGDSSTPSKIAGTYYGFVSNTSTLTRAELKVVKGLENTPIRVTKWRPSYRRTMYRNCSDDLADLLLNSLRAALAVPKALDRAALALGVRGDLRAVSSLEIGLERAHQSWRVPGALQTWSRLSWALREIGHPVSECICLNERSDA